jgi:hypothetical protein
VEFLHFVLKIQKNHTNSCSVLGPELISIYIKNCRFHNYADDLQLYKSCNNFPAVHDVNSHLTLVLVRIKNYIIIISDSSRYLHSKKVLFENGHTDFVLSEHKLFAFCVENSKISHKFVLINVFFKLSNTILCSDNTKSL